jgi:hypothetical protein
MRLTTSWKEAMRVAKKQTHLIEPSPIRTVWPSQITTSWPSPIRETLVTASKKRPKRRRR